MPEELTGAIPTIITADITPTIITTDIMPVGSLMGTADLCLAVLAIAAVPSWQAAGALPAGDATLDALVE